MEMVIGVESFGIWEGGETDWPAQSSALAGSNATPAAIGDEKIEIEMGVDEIAFLHDQSRTDRGYYRGGVNDGKPYPPHPVRIMGIPPAKSPNDAVREARLAAKQAELAAREAALAPVVAAPQPAGSESVSQGGLYLRANISSAVFSIRWQRGSRPDSSPGVASDGHGGGRDPSHDRKAIGAFGPKRAQTRFPEGRRHGKKTQMDPTVVEWAQTPNSPTSSSLHTR
jgi:hypothetical protein